MIKVTDEMVQVLASFFATDVTEVVGKTHSVAKRIIELHEANKPKPEPVGYIYKHRLEQMLNSEVDNDCNFFPIKDEKSRAIFNKNREKYLALYAEHLTRKPKPEPFGYFKAEPFGWTDCEEGDDGAIALYEAPPTREPLSDEEIFACWDKDQNSSDILWFARAIEQAHGIGANNA